MSRRSAALKLADAAPLFAALGGRNATAAGVALVHDGPLSIARLSEGTAITRQGITKHLHALADAGLVKGSQQGRERIWELEPRRLARARGVPGADLRAVGCGHRSLAGFFWRRTRKHALRGSFRQRGPPARTL